MKATMAKIKHPNERTENSAPGPAPTNMTYRMDSDTVAYARNKAPASRSMIPAMTVRVVSMPTPLGLIGVTRSLVSSALGGAVGEGCGEGKACGMTGRSSRLQFGQNRASAATDVPQMSQKGVAVPSTKDTQDRR